MAENKTAITESPEDLAATVRDDSRPLEERTAARTKLNELSKQAGENRKEEISKIKDEDERKVVELYNQGVQNFAIAKQVYKFANGDTVAQVVNIIRKHHADDFDQTEELKQYRGYIGI